MQSTGEDWRGVELAMNTANMDIINNTIPVLSPTKIRPPKPTIFGGYSADSHVQTQLRPQQVRFGQPSLLGQTGVTGLFGQSGLFGQTTHNAWDTQSDVQSSSFGRGASAGNIFGSSAALVDD